MISKGLFNSSTSALIRGYRIKHNGQLRSSILNETVLKAYFLIQYRMINRQFKEFGLHPIVGYLLFVVGFVLITEYAYFKTEYAAWLLCFSAVSVLFRFSLRTRSEFLIMAFGDVKKKQIRLIENGMISLPFTLSLLLHHAYVECAVLLFLSISTAILDSFRSQAIVIPTPYSRRPFEFLVGFRKTYFLLPLILVLIGIAVKVENPNLGIFAMLTLQFFIITFYLQPEDEYYIWIYSLSPRAFLSSKIKTASWYSILSITPVAVVLWFLFPDALTLILIFWALGLVFLWAVILAKYSAHPREIHLPEIVILGLCIYLPFLLILAIPYFYAKANHRLSSLLK